MLGDSEQPRRYARRLARWWSERRWLIAAVLWVFALSLGYYGFKDHRATALLPPLDLAYLTAQLIPMNSGSGLIGEMPVSLQIARFLIPLLAGYTIILTAFTIFRRQLEEIRLRSVRDHVVICGLDTKGSLLAQGFLSGESVLVVIDNRAANPALERFRGDRVFRLIGDATQPDLLRRARVNRATHLIAVCGDDGVNAAVALAAEEANAHRKQGTLTCSIHIYDSRLSELVQDHVFLAGREGFHLEVFDIYQRGARLTWEKFPPPTSSADRPPRVLLVGLGQMGESLIEHAGYWWHDLSLGLETRLSITVIATGAQSQLASLLVRHSPLAQVCALTPMEMDPSGPEFETGAFLFAESGEVQFDIIYVCLDNAAAAIQCGLRLQRRLDTTPIVIHTETESGLARLLGDRPGSSGAFANLHTFAVLPSTLTPASIKGGSREVLARAIHQKYVQEQTAKGIKAADNPNVVPWEALTREARESNRQQATHMAAKLQAAGYRLQPLQKWEAASFTFTEEEVKLMARMEHERYVAERSARGWRYSPTRDDARKLHPALVPWDKLSADYQEINLNTVRHMPGFLAKEGFQLVKVAPQPTDESEVN